MSAGAAPVGAIATDGGVLPVSCRAAAFGELHSVGSFTGAEVAR